jgi:hypothetical protein
LHSFQNLSQVMKARFYEFNFIWVVFILQTHISEVGQQQQQYLPSRLCTGPDVVTLNGVVHCMSLLSADTWSWHLQGNGHSLRYIVTLNLEHVLCMRSCSSVWELGLIQLVWRHGQQRLFEYAESGYRCLNTRSATYSVIMYVLDSPEFIWAESGVVWVPQPLRL